MIIKEVNAYCPTCNEIKAITITIDPPNKVKISHSDCSYSADMSDYNQARAEWFQKVKGR